MKITKIISLKGYKSFDNFIWGKYCKRQNKDGSCVEPQMSKFSVFFGENGSGKSSLCDILKSFSDNKELIVTQPQSAEIAVDDNSSEVIYTFNSGSWSSKVPSSSILFFDVDFINANVHTNGLRSSNLNSGAHTQKSGKLIIDLDQKADVLNTEAVNAKGNLDIFEKSNTLLIQQKYLDDEFKLYDEYKNLSKNKYAETISDLEKYLKKAEEEYGTLNKLTTKSSDIQKITTREDLKFEHTLSDLGIYKEITARAIEKKVEVEVDEIIKAHFEKHKSFIEYAKNQIPSDYSKANCPLCMQPLNNASTVIEYYRSVFDKSFDDNKVRFLRDINVLALELTNIESFANGLERKITQYFDTYEQIKDNFDLVGLYRIEEKTNILNLVNKLSTVSIQTMKQGLEGLKLIEKIPFDPLKPHKEISDVLVQISEVVSEFNSLVVVKTKIVTDL